MGRAPKAKATPKAKAVVNNPFGDGEVEGQGGSTSSRHTSTSTTASSRRRRDELPAMQHDDDEQWDNQDQEAMEEEEWDNQDQEAMEEEEQEHDEIVEVEDEDDEDELVEDEEDEASRLKGPALSNIMTELKTSRSRDRHKPLTDARIRTKAKQLMSHYKAIQRPAKFATLVKHFHSNVRRVIKAMMKYKPARTRNVVRPEQPGITDERLQEALVKVLTGKFKSANAPAPYEQMKMDRIIVRKLHNDIGDYKQVVDNDRLIQKVSAMDPEAGRRIAAKIEQDYNARQDRKRDLEAKAAEKREAAAAAREAAKEASKAERELRNFVNQENKQRSTEIRGAERAAEPRSRRGRRGQAAVEDDDL